MGRRDKNDTKWKLTREQVFRRDNHSCRLLRVLSMKEALQLHKNGSFLLKTLDPCHILPVGRYPELTYTLENIVIMNRASHTWLDSSRSPIDGAVITQDAVRAWWKRIAGEHQWDALERIQEDTYGRRDSQPGSDRA